MESNAVVRALGALANEHRLKVFRMLVQAGPQGLSAGTMSGELALPASSLSFHLKDLLNAELLQARHEGRQVIYSVRFATMNGLVAFLTENCCARSPCSPASPCSTTQQGACS